MNYIGSSIVKNIRRVDIGTANMYVNVGVDIQQPNTNTWNKKGNISMETNLFTPQEVADLLRVSSDTIRRCIRKGTIKAIKIGDQYRIKQSEIEKILCEPTKQQKKIANQVEREIVQSALDEMKRR